MSEHISNPAEAKDRNHSKEPRADDRNGHEHTHEWVVFSTALAECWLMLQCVGCGLHGIVETPTTAEWSDAFHAPSRPYRWPDEARVVVKGQRGTHRYVVPAAPGPRCECYYCRNVPTPNEYERFPVEILTPALALTEKDTQELQELAEVACKGSLCSFFFHHFLQCFQQDTGYRQGETVLEVARRIEVLDRMGGIHCSPSVVTRVLREVATVGSATFSDPSGADGHF